MAKLFIFLAILAFVHSQDLEPENSGIFHKVEQLFNYLKKPADELNLDKDIIQEVEDLPDIVIGNFTFLREDGTEESKLLNICLYC